MWNRRNVFRQSIFWDKILYFRYRYAIVELIVGSVFLQLPVFPVRPHKFSEPEGTWRLQIFADLLKEIEYFPAGNRTVISDLHKTVLIWPCSGKAPARPGKTLHRLQNPIIYRERRILIRLLAYQKPFAGELNGERHIWYGARKSGGSRRYYLLRGLLRVKQSGFLFFKELRRVH